jgi:hypothetical protein
LACPTLTTEVAGSIGVKGREKATKTLFHHFINHHALLRFIRHNSTRSLCPERSIEFFQTIFAVMSGGQHRVPFENVIVTMRRTGKDLPSLYRETSEGGLAIDHLR